MARTVADQPDLSTLKATLAYVDGGSDEKLMTQMATAGDKTLFEPNNAAFDKLTVDLIGPGSKATDLLTPQYKDDLRDVLKTHLMAGRLLQSSLVNGSTLAVELGTGWARVGHRPASACQPAPAAAQPPV